MSPTTDEETTPAQQEPELTAAQQLEADRDEIVERIAWGD